MRKSFRAAYFTLRPYVPRALRLAVRRRVARRARNAFPGSWPINPTAAKPPENWAGWPDGKKFAFVLTHDVEGAKGLGRCLELADLEIRCGFRSSFNFVPEGEYQTPKMLRDFLTDYGFEVGVHDLHHDGKLYTSPQRFAGHAARINHYLREWGAAGFRSGFMLHELNWLTDLNILYDASSFDTDPFEPQPEGENTIFPFWVEGNGGAGYVELPYTLPQDSTLFTLLQEEGIDIWIKKLAWVASHGGMALVGVHPDYLSFGSSRGPYEYPVCLYKELLQHVASTYAEEAWFALPVEVAEHVRDSRAGVSRLCPACALFEKRQA
jgi:hypothetical protein